jgi:hypothetical protein
MATIPAAATWTPGTGSETTAAILNARIRDAVNFLTGKPLCVLRKNATQSVPHDTWTDVTWQLEDIDTDAGHSTVTNTHLYTAQTAGWYYLTASIEFSGHAAQYRQAKFVCSTGVEVGEHTVMLNGSTHGSDVCTSAHLYMAVGQTVKVQAWQDSGTTLNIQNDSLDSRFEIAWVSA